VTTLFFLACDGVTSHYNNNYPNLKTNIYRNYCSISHAIMLSRGCYRFKIRIENKELFTDN
jgi:hypothetical protein